jgi:all-trans-retinol 13,14-reductase
MYLFVGIKGTSEENKIHSKNYWVYDTMNYDEIDQYSSKGPLDPDNKKIYFISSNSAKDPDFNNRYPNSSTILVIGFAKKEWF